MFDINNRRYIGNKYKLMDWIAQLINENCEGDTFFDVFAGSGSVSDYLIDNFNHFVLNDFLYSNEIVYKGFFEKGIFDIEKLENIIIEFNNLKANKLRQNYVSKNYGNRFFSMDDAKKIGLIRENINKLKRKGSINQKEHSILLSSLLYSIDRIANTCGHYDAYIKGDMIKPSFYFQLINPVDVSKKTVEIYRMDSNKLARRIKADVAFVDPPYNSRQYSRFYHVLENIVQWKKPKLFGVAMKPEVENMSEYCKTSAPAVFEDLIKHLNSKYIVVTYNNTYVSKSSSSQNKITLEEIEAILEKKGKTKVFYKSYKAFQTGKTELPSHKEYVFITKVGEKNES